MKQGTKKRLAPKDKHDTASWKKRNAARKDKQDAHAEAVAAQQAADAEAAQEHATS